MGKIFGKNEKLEDKNTTNFGIPVSPRTKMFYTLYGIYLGKNRTAVVRDVLNKEKQRVENEEYISEAYMMEALADEAVKEWKRVERVATFEHFVKQVEDELRKKKLESDYIERIVNKIDRKINYAAEKSE